MDYEPRIARGAGFLQPRCGVVEELQLRVYGDASLPVLIYLPGLHGDWTLITRFRPCVEGKVRFVEFTYPRTLEWSLADYASEIVKALNAHAITQGWLLAESFGSQIVWPILANHPEFQARGVILAGGFGRHPLGGLLKIALRFGAAVPNWICRILFSNPRILHFWKRRPPEKPPWLIEFLERRTPLDIEAAAHRLRLLTHHDPAPSARATKVPIYHLSGGWDFVVPWGPAQRWLRRHCDSYRGGHVIWQAEHVVLLTTPAQAAKQILTWMQSSVSSL